MNAGNSSENDDQQHGLYPQQSLGVILKMVRNDKEKMERIMEKENCLEKEISKEKEINEKENENHIKDLNGISTQIYKAKAQQNVLNYISNIKKKQSKKIRG